MLEEENFKVKVLEVDDSEMNVFKALHNAADDENEQSLLNSVASNPEHGHEFARVGHNEVRIPR